MQPNGYPIHPVALEQRAQHLKKKQNKHYNHHILNGYHTQMDTLES